jgi:hypothetical protein
LLAPQHPVAASEDRLLEPSLRAFTVAEGTLWRLGVIFLPCVLAVTTVTGLYVRTYTFTRGVLQGPSNLKSVSEERINKSIEGLFW